MQGTPTVDGAASTKRRVVSTKYPEDRIALLEAVQKRRGDDFLSRTVSAALDRMIETHFPGATEGD